MGFYLMPQSNDNVRIRLAFVGSPEINATPAQIEGNIDPINLKISFKVAVEVNRPESMVNVIVSMVYLLGQDTVFSGSLKTGFEVIDLSSYISIPEGEDAFRIESDFFPMLINIAFSTTRGYFAKELTGTILEPFPFPMIPMETINKKTSFQLI